MSYDDILHNVDVYYSNKVNTHGTSHCGVDWNSTESQMLRFDQVLKVCDSKAPFSINDYGCGYGALAAYLNHQGLHYTYYGFDISLEMISRARKFANDITYSLFFTYP